MAKIIQFPSAVSYTALRVRRGSQHDVSVRVLDSKRPKEARWHLQFAIQRSASFRALRGFTDLAARRQQWHDFAVNRTQLLRRFLIDVETLVAAGRVAIVVDGTRVRIASGKVA